MQIRKRRFPREMRMLRKQEGVLDSTKNRCPHPMRS
jgi:hypothetical protein